MTVFQALVLGVVQGLTEFLPISSSGHLVLFSKLPYWNEQPLVFDTTLHLATALTLVVYFWRELLSLFTSRSKLLIYIVLGSIPAGVLGFLFESDFENRFRSVESVAFFLFLGTILMIGAQKFAKTNLIEKDLTLRKSIIVGIFQSLALFPGISRSGSTISGGLLVGLIRVDAARFSFLLSIPIVVLAGFYKFFTEDWSGGVLSFSVLSVGFLSSFLVGLFVVHFMLGFLKKHSLNLFIYYRLALVAVLLLLLV